MIIPTKLNLQEFSSEAVLWRQLSHPNILPFYGIHHLEEVTPRLCLTSPWMPNGNAVEFLKQNQDTYCIHLVSRTTCTYTTLVDIIT